MVATIAQCTPLYGLNQLVHAPMLNQGVDLAWVVNVVIWLAIFVGGAVWRFRRTPRGCRGLAVAARLTGRRAGQPAGERSGVVRSGQGIDNYP